MRHTTGIEPNLKTRPSTRSHLLAAATLFVTIASPAYAQQSVTDQPPVSTATTSASTEAAPGDIIVTATKRSTKLDQTPMSITALTGEQLAKSGIHDITTALQGVPGVSFASAGPGKTVFNIRGLSSSGGAASTVGFYIDEVPISSPAHSTNGKTAIDPALYDLAQVEVLRGPQGTLYGASSMGGTIKLETNQPKLGVFEGSTHMGISNLTTGGLGYSLDGMINIPLIDDKAALRVVVSHKYDNGYVDRIVNPDFPAAGGATRGDVSSGPTQRASTKGGDNNVTSIRSALTIKPVDFLEITASLLRQREHENDQGLVDVPPSRMAHYQPYDVAEPSHDNVDLYSLVGKADLGFAQLESASSWLKRTIFQQEDESETLSNLFGSGFPAGTNFIPTAISETHPEHAFTEEVRLTSSGHHRLDWLLGGYYSTFSDSFVDAWQVPQFANNPNFGTGDVFHYNERDRIKQVAAFGQATFHFTDKLSVTGGLRWFHYDNSFQVTQSGLVAGISPASGKEARSGVTPKVDIDYQITPNNMIYASAAKGYRPGGANVPVPLSGAADCSASLAAAGVSPSAAAQYGPDSLWNYEVGTKDSFFDRRLNIHAAAYYIDWKQIQQQVVLACGYNITQNVGRAVSKGFDFDFNLKLSDDWRLSGGGGLTDAKLQDNTPAGGVAGQQLQDVPEWTHNIALDYRRPIGEAVGTATFEYRHVSSSHDALGQLPSYDTFNLRTGLEWKDWRGSLFIRNLTNQRPTLSFTNDLAVNVPDLRRAAIMQPRIIGLEVSFSFK